MHLTDGTVFLTRGVAALSSEYQAAMVKRVLAFDDCAMQKDPYTVHDFSAFDHQGHRILLKIALYDEPGVKGWDSDANSRPDIMLAGVSDAYSGRSRPPIERTRCRGNGVSR